MKITEIKYDEQQARLRSIEELMKKVSIMET